MAIVDCQFRRGLHSARAGGDLVSVSPSLRRVIGHGIQRNARGCPRRNWAGWNFFGGALKKNQAIGASDSTNHRGDPDAALLRLLSSSKAC